MRVLIEQQFHLGHHYQYVAHLLPALSNLVDEVVVAITPAGRESAEFESSLAAFSDRVRFEPMLPEATPSYPMAERLDVHRHLRRAVAAVAPDYVLIPSGDAQATAMALYRWTARGSLPGSVPCEVGIHFGSGRDAGARTRLSDWLNGLNLGLSGCKRIHLVNHLFWERLRHIPALGGVFSPVPHPVLSPARVSASESRTALGVPAEGRYIGLAASLDSRKALNQFIHAFRAATSSPNDRLLLAGWMSDTQSHMIRQEHPDLLASGRLILKTGFLDQRTFQAAISALDVVCTPYPGFGGLSSTLLEAIGAGRPVLANSYGWCKAIVERFSIGWTCDVLDHEVFTRTIRTALSHFGDYKETEAIRRLRMFHSPDNYVSTWLHGIRQASGLDGPQPRTWEWVEAGHDSAIGRT
jgi:glycosyltransferase involved in cell wall biosynthesis